MARISHRVFVSTAGLSVAFMVAGCGGAGHGTQTSAGGSTTDTGGTTSTASGGNAGSASGGSSANPGSSSTGGSLGNGGGNAGRANGGAPGDSGAAGTTPGTMGGASGGSKAQGGASPSDGGAASGGVQANGGTPGSGGAPGTGGTVSVTEPKLITSGQDGYWKTATWTEVTSGTVDVTVNDATANQRWDGFGGTFNEMGWNVLATLSAGDRDRAMKLLFDASDGARFVFGRIPIGASDYAMDRYTLNDTANDSTMAGFSIERDRQKLIPYIKAALAINTKIHLWASPWSPPAWMKDNNKSDGGNMRDDASVLDAHALYLSKFVEEYGKEGITIEAIHPQNEPGYSTNYPSCLWTAALFNKFIRDYLGPTFATRNITAGIYVGTMSNNDSGKDGTILTTVTGDSATMKLIKGFGLQWNMLPVVSGLKSKNLQIVQTEHQCGNYPWNPSGFPAFNANQAPNDYPYAVESWGHIRDWIKAGVNVYSAWNMVLDTVGKNLDSVRPWPQNALLTVDTSAKTLNLTPTYYVFRHVSQYVDPGATVLGTTGGDALAFKNPDGSLVAIVHNTATSAKTMIVSLGGKKLQLSVPANGFATLNPGTGS